MLVKPDALVFALVPDDESPDRIEGSAFVRTLLTSFFVSPDAALTCAMVSVVRKLLISLLISIQKPLFAGVFTYRHDQSQSPVAVTAPLSSIS